MKSQDLQEIPDSQDSEHGQDIWDTSHHRDEGQDSTPTLPKSKVQAKVYPASPDSHLASPKRTKRDWDHQVDDDKGEGASSQPMTREKQSRSFQVPTTPTRQSRLLTCASRFALHCLCSFMHGRQGVFGYRHLDILEI